MLRWCCTHVVPLLPEARLWEGVSKEAGATAVVVVVVWGASLFKELPQEEEVLEMPESCVPEEEEAPASSPGSSSGTMAWILKVPVSTEAKAVKTSTETMLSRLFSCCCFCFSPCSCFCICSSFPTIDFCGFGSPWGLLSKSFFHGLENISLHSRKTFLIKREEESCRIGKRACCTRVFSWW